MSSTAGAVPAGAQGAAEVGRLRRRLTLLRILTAIAFPLAAVTAVAAAFLGTSWPFAIGAALAALSGVVSRLLRRKLGERFRRLRASQAVDAGHADALARPITSVTVAGPGG